MSNASTPAANTASVPPHRARPVMQPRNNFERVAWLFMRYSGLVLIFLALSHWGLQHVFNSVHDLTLQSTINRWGIVGQVADFTIWFWRGYYTLLLGLAMLHGLNGLRQVAYDYMHIRPLYLGFMALSTILIAAITVAGLIALFMGVNAATASAIVIR